jgi:hypothetical protein
MSDQFTRPYDVLGFEFDPTDLSVTISILDPIRSSREYGVMPELRQIRLDGMKWEGHVNEILSDIMDLITEVEQAGTPMTRAGRGAGTDDPAE